MLDRTGSPGSREGRDVSQGGRYVGLMIPVATLNGTFRQAVFQQDSEQRSRTS